MFRSGRRGADSTGSRRARNYAADTRPSGSGQFIAQEGSDACERRWNTSYAVQNRNPGCDGHFVTDFLRVGVYLGVREYPSRLELVTVGLVDRGMLSDREPAALHPAEPQSIARFCKIAWELQRLGSGEDGLDRLRTSVGSILQRGQY
jgi:hypothetical protein